MHSKLCKETAMNFLEIKGSKSDVEFSFSELGINAANAHAIVDYLQKNKELLGDDECIKISTEFPSFPPGVIGLMIPKTNYYINIKVTTIVVAAFLADISFSNGVMSMLLGMCGFSNTAFAELNEELGEKCIVRETLARNPKEGFAKILAPFKGECCNNDLSCKFRIENKCHCTEDDVLGIYEKLADRNMFSRIGNMFKYQW